MLFTEAANRLGLDTGKLLNFGIGTNNDNSSQRYRVYQNNPVLFQYIQVVEFPEDDNTGPIGFIGNIY